MTNKTPSVPNAATNGDKVERDVAAANKHDGAAAKHVADGNGSAASERTGLQDSSKK